MARHKTNLFIGATGFIGSNLANDLASKGEKEIGTYLNQPSRGRFHPKVKLVRCDVTKRLSVNKLLRKVHPDFVFFLAAQSSVRQAWLEPVKTFQVNLLGGVHLLKELHALQSKARIIIFSSGTCYGSSHRAGFPVPEEACLNPKE